MADMHLYIRDLLDGKIPQYSPTFREGKNKRATDREDYQQYIPALCDFIANEKNDSARHHAFFVLRAILPDAPERNVVEFLLNRLEREPLEMMRSQLLFLLPTVRIPAGVSLEPLKALVRTGDSSVRTWAINAFSSVEGDEGELFLLEVLRRTDDSYNILVICGVLKKIGTIFSLPVLMARLEPGGAESNEDILPAIEAITARLELDGELRNKFRDPGFWRISWKGSPQSFVKYMTILNMMTGGNPSEEQEDQLAEIFIKEMDVDITPFQSYRELRLCTSGKDLEEDIEKTRDYMQSELLMDIALNGTGVSPSNETMWKDLYFDMMNDYLMTRLRRKIAFAGDSY